MRYDGLGVGLGMWLRVKEFKGVEWLKYGGWRRFV